MKKPDRERHEQPAKALRISRRNLLKTTPLALAAGSMAVPPLLASLAGESNAQVNSGNLHLEPKYYPLSNFTPEINLQGKLAIVTGASRGNGRAVGEALAALGVNVIGTSRNPAGVPNPPAFPLLALDIADAKSIFAFRKALFSHPTFLQRGKVDILVNNAGRNVLGRITPPSSPKDLGFFLKQRDLGFRTLYSGHVMMTNTMLPLMSQNQYARIIFTVSVTSYFSGAAIAAGSYTDVYFSSKNALRVYANNLATALRASGSIVRVSTVNPYSINTKLAEHPNPIYTQPVNNLGLSDTDPAFNEVVTLTRQLLANALPTSMVGQTYAQLLSMAEPERNVVVASPQEPFATQGANAIVEGLIIAENQISAVPFGC